MSDAFTDVHAALRALQGECDLDVVRPALSNGILVPVIACASSAHPIVQTIAALCDGLPAMINPATLANPALHDAVARMIGTNEGWYALDTWAWIIPAGWGHAHEVALIEAVENHRCPAGSAAALIGPNDNAAGLLRHPVDIAFALRRWVQSSPDAPTAWMGSLSAGERKRLLNTLHSDPHAVARCLPWMSPDETNRSHIKEEIGTALAAFAAASPTERARRADLLQRLVRLAQPAHLGELTRLACAIQEDEVWRRIVALVEKTPDAAGYVVAAAPWNDVSEKVRTTILNCADRSDICAAIAVARGEKRSMAVMDVTAVAFFAALDPKVWNVMDIDVQRVLRQALHEDEEHGYLAVRSLGLRPEFLALAPLDHDLVRAAQRHAHELTALQNALLPVALRRVNADSAYALIAALPTPPISPGEFFAIASGDDEPSMIAPASAILRALTDLACAVVLRRCANSRDMVRSCCAALHDALHGQSWNDVHPLLSILDADARAAIFPDPGLIVDRVAHPDRRDALRETFDRLSVLSIDVAIPAWFALYRLGTMIDDDAHEAYDAAEACALVLRRHGDLFLDIVDALTDDVRTALLPLPKNRTLADALRNLAHDDPLSARSLAHALRHRSFGHGAMRLKSRCRCQRITAMH